MIASSAPTTIENVQRFLAYYGIPGVVLDNSRLNDDRSRIFAIDTQGRLLGHCTAHPKLWSRDVGGAIDTLFHGKGIRASFRSRTTPSMQVCVHEVIASPDSTDLDYFLEIDFDEHSPEVSFVGHAREVATHEVTGSRTDPAVIAAGLDRLLA